MAKDKKNVHVVEFPLIATSADINSVQVRFSFLRELYNAALGELLKRNNRLIADPVYQEKLAAYRVIRKTLNKTNLAKSVKKDLETQRKELSKELGEKNTEYGVTEAAIQSFTTANKNACCFSDHLDAHTTQTIATRCFKAFSGWKYRGRGKPRFKSWQRGIRSAEGKARSCLTIKLGDEKKSTRLIWKGIEIPLKLDQVDKQGYESHALDLIGQNKWKYCRILTRVIRGEAKLYLQVVLDGASFKKAAHRERSKAGIGKKVGVDMAPQGFAAVSLLGAMLSPLGDDIKSINTEIIKLQRQNSRRLRLLNPDNYTTTEKKKGRKTVTVFKVKKGARNWVKSNAYLADQAKIKELYRQMTVRRKQGHDILANDIIALGNIVMAEKLSYKAWQKMFGRSVGANAPSQFISTLRRKAENAGGRMIDINTRSSKLSQYDHVLDEYRKKSLKERVHFLGEKEAVQRDLYSAFLAMCTCEKEHVVLRTVALEAWTGVRHSLDAAVTQAIQTASSRAMPTSFGLRELRSLQSERLAA